MPPLGEFQEQPSASGQTSGLVQALNAVAVGVACWLRDSVTHAASTAALEENQNIISEASGELTLLHHHLLMLLGSRIHFRS